MHHLMLSTEVVQWIVVVFVFHIFGFVLINKQIANGPIERTAIQIPKVFRLQLVISAIE